MWQHISIADSQPGVPEFPASARSCAWRWNQFPTAAIAGSPGSTRAVADVCAYRPPWWADVSAPPVQPVPDSQPLQFLGAGFASRIGPVRIALAAVTDVPFPGPA